MTFPTPQPILDASLVVPIPAAQAALRVCVAQLNLTVGDLAGNAAKIIAAARAAYAQGARLVITPELSICGYPPEDLLLRPAFMQACDEAVQRVATELADLRGLHVVVGHPTEGDRQGDRQGDGLCDGLGVSQGGALGEVKSKSVSVQRRHNSASVLCEGRQIATYAKRELPNYQVFDERRYFAPGQGTCVFQAGGVSVGLLICEDAWFEEPARLAQEAGAQLLVVINASPWHIGKGAERQAQMRERAISCALPLVYAHCVGGQDEIVFEGCSFALHADGRLIAQAASFKEDLLFLEQKVPVAGIPPARAAIELIASNEQEQEPRALAAPRSNEADLWDALVLGVRDYMGKNGFPGALLGLSGGIDSALVLAIAVDALGKDNIRTVMMPSPYTADISWIDAREMASRMGVRYDEISILPMFEAFKATLANEFKGLAEDTTEENIQARIRGTLLMALSNKFGAIVLTTGNKSEMATGYCTLYGDMAGGFAVIKDVMKTSVFELCRWRNANDPYGTGSNPIPERIITRPPSAELRADQTDQDSLPPYDVLDAILERYMENDQSIDSIIAEGFAREDVERVTRLIKINEYKRRQAPIGIRVTHRSFGKDWRYPVTSKFRG